MELGIKNKTAVVTGGSTGLGAEIVKLFASEGVNVVFTDIDDKNGVLLEEQLKSNSVGTVVFECSDVASEDDVKKLADNVSDRFGGCDFLVNNAGILRGGRIHELESEDWDIVQKVNARGVFLTCKYFIPHMLEKKGGSIVNISSVSGLYGDYESAAYNTSKGAVTNFTRALALDYAKDNIRVNAVCPGSMRTPMYHAVAEAIGKEKCEQIFTSAYPGGRIGEPYEIAKVVLFLVSELSVFVNGVNLPVDGGLSAHTGQPKFN